MNWANRTVFTGDNLDVMRGMDSETVDLIYADPPFNSNRSYAAPIGSRAAGAAFKDTWTLDDIDEAWLAIIADQHPGPHAVIEAAGIVHGDGMKSYLCMMAIRLLEMQRILKPTGSIYIHCDDTAGHYLKLLLDSVYGHGAFRNAVIWRRFISHNDPGRYGRIADYLLFYSAGKRWTWNVVREPPTKEQIAAAYPQQDDAGRWYRSADLTGPHHGSGGESARPWNGYDVASRGRVWSPPLRGSYAAYIEERWLPGYKAIKGVHERLDALDAAGLIIHPTRGFWPGLKRYAEADKGKPLQDIIYNPTGLTNYSGAERLGYPTQKPLGILERIIEASSAPGDMVFDPFCGCATALIAAERLTRQWVGIDISPLAIRLVRQRLRREVPLFTQDAIDRTDVPTRTDLVDEVREYITERELLYGRQRGNCAGCRVHFEARNLEVDHVIPRVKGGPDHISNYQLLCGSCNRRKGTGSQAELLAKLRRDGIIAA